ncbi:MAG: ABC transporter ATP-binding protein [Patescibacteria group bacterium]
MPDIVLHVENLVKDYGKFRAVNDISFDIEKGKIIGFLGPNGAGKTTTIQILLGITTSTSGKIEYFGKNFFTHREDTLQKINFTSAFNTLQGKITVWENLLVFGYLYGLKNPKNKILELTEYFEITDLLHTIRYTDLSSGQKTRVNLVKSLLNDPEIILMDEPTASLDPDIADKTLQLIETLKKERNITLLYTSHNMDEITRICDEVIFLDHGKIVAHDTPHELTKQIGNTELLLMFDMKKEVIEKFLVEHKLVHTFKNHDKVDIKLHESLIPEVLYKLSHKGIQLTNIEIKKPTLEDVFLQIARD